MAKLVKRGRKPTKQKEPKSSALKKYMQPSTAEKVIRAMKTMSEKDLQKLTNNDVIKKAKKILSSKNDFKKLFGNTKNPPRGCKFALTELLADARVARASTMEYKQLYDYVKRYIKSKSRA